MTYLITEACVGTKDHSCIDVCPVDCIHPTPEEEAFEMVKQLYIDPAECIDCNSCTDACPVDACVPDYEVPPGQEHMIEENARFFAN